MQRFRRIWFPFLLGSLFITFVTLPYIWAYQNSGGSHWFGGFLLNPIDGNSYQAKMYQGWQGNWRFQLPYTVEPGEGGYLFLFYLALGHIARLSSGRIQIIFHLARIAGAIALVISLWHFYSKVFDNERSRWLAFGLALFGSGMGWLASMFGIFSADFWVAEGYPFLAAYANPHFPLGLAIMLWILTPRLDKDNHWEDEQSNLHRILIVAAGFLLAIILPFGVVIAGAVLAGLVIWELWVKTDERKDLRGAYHLVKSLLRQTEPGEKFILMLLGSFPVLAYQVWVTRSDPVLAAWNAQNLTASPPIWELLISYSPILLMAIPGVYFAVKRNKENTRVLLLWAGLGFLLLYIPWSLQRRFITGYMIPLAGLAAIGLDQLFSRKRIFGLAALCLVIIMIIPTNLMIILGGLQAIRGKEESIYLSQDEYQGLLWLETNTEAEAVILASPEMGLFIPAYTGRRVLYGHPFETPDAVNRETQLLSFFSGAEYGFDEQAILGAEYLFYGNRERELGMINISQGYELVFEAGDLQIFQIK